MCTAGAGGHTLRGRNFLQFGVECRAAPIDTYREPTVIRPLVQRDNVSMMFVPESRIFARAVNENRPPRSPGVADARRVLRVVDAVLESGAAVCLSP